MTTIRSWQQPFLGLRQFPPLLTDFEIGYFFAHSADEMAAIRTRRGDHHKIAASIHLGFIKMTGRTLDAFDHIPLSVLTFVGDRLGVQALEISTLRALYKRKPTLFSHQMWAAELLGFSPYNERRQRVLITQLRGEADKANTIGALALFAKRWLYDRKILLPSQRRIQRMAARAHLDADRVDLAYIQKVVPESVRRQ